MVSGGFCACRDAAARRIALRMMGFTSGSVPPGYSYLWCDRLTQDGAPGTSKSKDKIQGFFPLRQAQGQNDDLFLMALSHPRNGTKLRIAADDGRGAGTSK